MTEAVSTSRMQSTSLASIYQLIVDKVVSKETNVHLIGLFATTQISTDADYEAVNPAVWRNLPSGAYQSRWFTGVPLGPHAERLQLPDGMESRGETVLVENVHLLKTRFLLAIAEMANSAQPGDTLVIVICGHSAETWNGDIIIGGETEDVPLQKDEVAVALRRIVIPPERLFVVSTACFLGQWGSDLWTFLAATDSATSRRTKQVSDYPALEPEEKAELFRLATEYDKRPHGSSASEVPVNAKSRKVAANHPIAPRDERVLLTRLRYRDHECRRASRIAEFLGWTPARPVEDWCHSNGLREMKEAEEAGAAIATEFFLGAEVGARVGRQRVWKTMVPGAWLANAWINTGRPIVTASRWKEATDYADSETDVQRP